MRLFLLPILVTLAACGFHPLHSRSYESGLSADLSSVEIDVDHSRRGQLLEAEIRQGINPTYVPAEKLYRLRISLTEREIPLFINRDGTSSRGDIRYTSKYVLSRIRTGEILQHGEISRISSYNTKENAGYASYVSEEDAKTRGIIDLAESYKLRLANLVPLLNGRAVMQEEVPDNAPTPPEIIPLPALQAPQ
jgi:hypothetical protein